jgi:hypothetical protein
MVIWMHAHNLSPISLTTNTKDLEDLNMEIDHERSRQIKDPQNGDYQERTQVALDRPR